jgi:hypothetical protein
MFAKYMLIIDWIIVLSITICERHAISDCFSYSTFSVIQVLVQYFNCALQENILLQVFLFKKNFVLLIATCGHSNLMIYSCILHKFICLVIPSILFVETNRDIPLFNLKVNLQYEGRTRWTHWFNRSIMCAISRLVFS